MSKSENNKNKEILDLIKPMPLGDDGMFVFVLSMIVLSSIQDVGEWFNNNLYAVWFIVAAMVVNLIKNIVFMILKAKIIQTSISK